MALVVLCAQVCCSQQAAAQTAQISRLAVMPLAHGMPLPASGRHVLDCRETELTTDGQIFDPGAQEVVTRCLQQALEKELPGRVAPQNETAGADELLAYMKKNRTAQGPCTQAWCTGAGKPYSCGYGAAIPAAQRYGLRRRPARISCFLGVSAGNRDRTDCLERSI